MQTARTDWACIIFTCIDKSDIVNKIRSLRHAIIIDIHKKGKDAEHPNRRCATAISNWQSRGGRSGFNYVWEEYFNCHMPDNFYNWYLPLRLQYSSMAKQLIKDKLEKKKDIMQFSIDV